MQIKLIPCWCICHRHPEYKHPYLSEREEVKRVGYIVVSTDRGLCGGLNTNMFKAAVTEMADWDEKDVEIDVCAIGKKAIGFFSRFKAKVVAEASHLGDSPSMEELIGAVKVMLSMPMMKAGLIASIWSATIL